MTRRLTGSDLETKNVAAEGLTLVNDRRIGNDDGDTTTIQLRVTMGGKQCDACFMHEGHQPVIAEMPAIFKSVTRTTMSVSKEYVSRGWSLRRGKIHLLGNQYWERNYISHRSQPLAFTIHLACLRRRGLYCSEKGE